MADAATRICLRCEEEKDWDSIIELAHFDFNEDETALEKYIQEQYKHDQVCMDYLEALKN